MGRDIAGGKDRDGRVSGLAGTSCVVSGDEARLIPFSFSEREHMSHGTCLTPVLLQRLTPLRLAPSLLMKPQRGAGSVHSIVRKTPLAAGHDVRLCCAV